ncbi:MAG: ABC transporter ATP-binding protein [Desulfobacteraceae bacterium]|jgi:peptide/nickel transport system ATP-binding protein
MAALLEVQDLRIEIEGAETSSPIVQDINFTVDCGEVVALIGESGSGKTTLCLSALGYVRPGLKITSGSIRFGETDVLSLKGKALRDFRGRRVAYVAQSAAAAFNPGITIDAQVVEPAIVHNVMPLGEARLKAVDLYRQLMLPDPDAFGRRYPHQVSGGQLQRLMAAMAMCCGPEMLVFDEPTTALDVTTQIDVLKAFKNAVTQQGVATIYISHDLAVVAQIADRIIVLLNGEIMEQGTTEEIICRPQHDYTRMLMAACDPDSVLAGACDNLMALRENACSNRKVKRIMTCGSESTAKKLERQTDAALLEIKNVTAGYGGLGRNGLPKIPILNDISLSVTGTSIVGIIGESGSGKTTLGRVIAGLQPLAQGEIRLLGNPLQPSVRRRSKNELRAIQMVFQMADTALNPAHTIEKILGRPIEYFQGITGKHQKKMVGELLELVQLPAHIAARKPQELSGGQKQRINLARAFAANPEIVICDEVTSGLDTIVRMSIIDLIRELHCKLGITFLFITHDISTIASLAEDIVVMSEGQVMEQGPVKKVLTQPEHPYTKVLMASVPHLRIGWLDEAIDERDCVLRATEAAVITGDVVNN